MVKNVAYLAAGICLLTGSYFIERASDRSDPVAVAAFSIIALCGFCLVMIAVSRWPWDRIERR